MRMKGRSGSFVVVHLATSHAAHGPLEARSRGGSGDAFGKGV